MKLKRELWHTDEINPVYLYSLSNENIELKISNLGCVFQSINIKDPLKSARNIVLGYESAAEYLADDYYVGCIMGRFAGRIAGASYEILNEHYHLSPNELNTGNHLHGGYHGFNKKIFNVVQEGEGNDSVFVKMSAVSPHMDEGHPGELLVNVTITLNKENEIITTYEAVTDKATHVNLTHHHYYNLSGEVGPATSQYLKIHADKYAGADENYIPDGTFRSVAGSEINYSNQRLVKMNSMDKCLNEYFLLNDRDGEPDAILSSSSSKIVMEIDTTYPCMVLYSGDFLGKPFIKSQGICLEPQFFPDSPHHSNFPGTLLHPGETYLHQTKMKFRNII